VIQSSYTLKSYNQTLNYI